ncbi:MAG: hypothetical protein RLZZ185_180 [Bacteroidota bacterium]|jgi:hypothetical protein
MELNKSQRLWYLLNRFDRDNQSVMTDLTKDQDRYPFFYLLNWNSNQGKNLLKKTALRSPIRTQFYHTHHDAPEVNPSIESGIEQIDIINQFLENLPTLTKSKKTSLGDDIEPSLDLSEKVWTPPVSETFAIILVKQQKYQQAIEIYEQLILAKPEKRLYFASRISDLQQNITE